MKNARTDGRKLGEVLAERIEDEIIERGWPVGQVLGSEADLIGKYDVSRAVFREAMRIVDHHGVAEMRRGPGGGLVVAAPDLEAVIRTVALHLEFLRIEPGQINEARMALELEVVRAAAERLTPDGAERIKQHLAHEVEDIKRTRELGRGAWRSPHARLPPAARRLDRQSGDASLRAGGRPGHRRARRLAPRHSMRRRPRCTAPISASPRRSSTETSTRPSDACAGTSRPSFSYLVPEGAPAPKPRRAAATRRRGGV